jgi:hypothetical protein
MNLLGDEFGKPPIHMPVDGVLGSRGWDW